MVALFIPAMWMNWLVVAVAWFAAIVPVFLFLRWLSRQRLRNARPIDRDEFNRLHSAWINAHGPLAGLISKTDLMQLKEARIQAEPYYSFKRVVVTDTHETTALLLANKFHIENECAVLCIDGYPFANWQQFVDLLRTNPQLEIALVHDATPAGCALPVRVRERQWFPETSFACVDAGLRPRQAHAMNLPVLRRELQPLPLAALGDLGPKDVRALQKGCYSELASLAPRRLITAITRNFVLLGIAGFEAPDSTSWRNSGGVWFFGSDDGISQEETFG